ncbi:MAG: 3-deoxy-manno-octulosonate cytidylyltransferase [Candidatus Omnitrophica bacterium]|nr:3-deoxy-manno-octulosonate cytidylyltransferase [Candidatus Omnitrophota bacterium]
MSTYSVIGVIPARYRSTRLPFKLLREVAGKPLLQHTWENASQARMLDKLLIACDDERIEEAARDFGAEVVPTSVQHTSGTDRIAEAVRDIDTQIIINIQADEPMIQPFVINRLATEMRENRDLMMATVKKKIERKEEVYDPGVVKVVCGKDDFALYFSRYAVPYVRDGQKLAHSFYKHVGIYAYTKDFLFTFKNLPPSQLEQAEKLEQLRALEAGFKIRVIETNCDCRGVDTEEDLAAVTRLLAEKKAEDEH